jgi:arylsulfatase A-like enzyme
MSSKGSEDQEATQAAPVNAQRAEAPGRAVGLDLLFILYSGALGSFASLPASAAEIVFAGMGYIDRSTPDPVGAFQIYAAHGAAIGLGLGVVWALATRVVSRPLVARRDALVSGLLLPGLVLLVVEVGFYVNRLLLPDFRDGRSIAANLAIVLFAACIALASLRGIARMRSDRSAVPVLPLALGLLLVAAGAAPFLLRFVPRVADANRPEVVASSVRELSGGSPFGDAPPVIVILVDTLRADHLSAYGYQRQTSPAIDRFARDAVLYANGYSVTSWTIPAVASVFSGLFPTSHTLTSASSILPDEVNTLAEVMQQLGYRTGGFIANTLIDREHGLQQGLERVYPRPAPRWFYTHPNALQLAYHHVFMRDAQARWGPRIVREAEGWLHTTPQPRVFAYVHLLEPHEPYLPPGEFSRRYDPGWVGRPVTTFPGRAEDGRRPPMSPHERRNMMAQYDGEIAYLDTLVGKFLDFLRTEGIYERALIALVADHGEEFYEHGKWGHDDNAHQEIARVPFMIKWPEQRFAGQRVETPVQLIDLKPTILHAVGYAATDRQQGRSLLAALEAGDGNEEEAVAFIETPSWVSVRTREWGYVVRRDSQDAGGRLYAASDAVDEHDVAAEHPRIVAELERRRHAWEQELEDGRLQERSRPLDAKRIEQLRELGYVE